MKVERRKGPLTPRELAAITTPGLVVRKVRRREAGRQEKSPGPVPMRPGHPPLWGQDQTNVLSRRRREARGVWT